MAPVRAAEIQALDVLSKTESSEISRRPLQASLSPRAGQELTAWRWTIGEGVSIVPPAAPGTPRS
jgi:hypothetical protein